MNILVSPGWGPGTKVSFKGAIKQFTYSLSQVKHRIHYNEKLVKISHPARRVTETNVSRFQYFVKMEKHNRPWYYLKLISLWLSRNNETLSRERGAVTIRCAGHLSSLNTDCSPELWSGDEAQSWFGSSEICSREFCTPWCQGPSQCITLLAVDFNFTMENGLLHWIGYWVGPCFIPGWPASPAKMD